MLMDSCFTHTLLWTRRGEGGSPRHYLVATPSSHANESSLDAPLTHSGAVMQGVLHGGIQQVHLARELDVRAAFAGLPRVNAHWTHRFVGSIE